MTEKILFDLYNIPGKIFSFMITEVLNEVAKT